MNAVDPAIDASHKATAPRRLGCSSRVRQAGERIRTADPELGKHNLFDGRNRQNPFANSILSRITGFTDWRVSSRLGAF
ncbi:MAG: hypothetical protein ACE5E5_14000 [Phycisphaerae bacterium]